MSICAEHLTKIYKIREGSNGGLLKNIFNPKFKYIEAVKDISFEINDGEFVGYIGANGAGKSTTLKMICGILTPTTGKVSVNGIVPQEKHYENAYQLGAVFGQRSQLLWDLPVKDSLELFKRMYCVNEIDYKKNYKIMDSILNINEFVSQPARQLSLGQKMKANIALAFIHNPKLIILDEPTIGLDVLAKDNIRQFLKTLKQETNCTVILTTHDLGDIEFLCDRIIMINNGEKIFDGKKEDFILNFSDESVISVVFASADQSIEDSRFVKIYEDGRLKKFKFSRSIVSNIEAIKICVNIAEVSDIKIEECKIEDVVKSLLRGKA